MESVAAVELEKQYLLQNYARFPLVIHRGKGCYVYDASGKRYLDLIAGIGVNALGYSHPRLTKVIREQAGLLLQHFEPLLPRVSRTPSRARWPKLADLIESSSPIPERNRWKAH